ncbi:DUF5956 family protein [Arthrobacter sp. UYEF20]|uniref:DUF5956 family protein n=1 Tax=Arthrobacter sp. UYEF20 TaxID=1756363 RepID=UPI00339A7DD9
MWQRFHGHGRPEGWIELTENGWGAIAAWFAGPENVTREPMGERTDIVRVACERADGTVTSWEETITEEDIRAIEDDIDSYLTDSGLPPRPRGYRWFLRLPGGVRDQEDFWGQLGEADSRMSHTNRDLVREAANLGATIRDLYAGKQGS